VILDVGPGLSVNGVGVRGLRARGLPRRRRRGAMVTRNERRSAVVSAAQSTPWRPRTMPRARVVHEVATVTWFAGCTNHASPAPVRSPRCQLGGLKDGTGGMGWVFL
jgi:hypothetical protein